MSAPLATGHCVRALRPGMQTPRSRATGFSLIEVLVALLILSLGLLGLAVLQTKAVRYNQGAYLRSQATSLAYDLADRMRANRQAALNGAYDGIGFTNPPPACGATGGTTVAARDISAWRTALACALPSGNGAIARNGHEITISVRWDASRGTGSPDTLDMTTSL